MGLFQDLKSVSDAFKERRGTRNVVREMNKQNSQEATDEKFINSITSELINTYYAVKEASKNSNVLLDGVIINPRPCHKGDEGTVRDPRVLIRAAQEDEVFKHDFSIEIISSDDGSEQYILRKRKFDEIFN